MPARPRHAASGNLDLPRSSRRSRPESCTASAVSRRIEQITGGTFIVQPGSLSALHRLEEAGAGLSSRVAGVRKQPARADMHVLTRTGRKQLGEETPQWNRDRAGDRPRAGGVTCCHRGARSVAESRTAQPRRPGPGRRAHRRVRGRGRRARARRSRRRANARRLTNLELGRIDSIVTQVTAGARRRRLRSVWHDVMFGARLLKRNPLFTATAVLSLGLGIGATTTMFSLVNARCCCATSQVADPSALVEVGRTTTNRARNRRVSVSAYERLRGENTVFAGVLALSKRTPSSPSMTGDGNAPSAGRFVSGNFFEVLGIGPAAGRVLSVRDDRLDDAADSAVAVISYRFWRRGFGAADVLQTHHPRRCRLIHHRRRRVGGV